MIIYVLLLMWLDAFSFILGNFLFGEFYLGMGNLFLGTCVFFPYVGNFRVWGVFCGNLVNGMGGLVVVWVGLNWFGGVGGVLW